MSSRRDASPHDDHARPEAEFEAFYKITKELRAARTPEEMYALLVDQTLALFRALHGALSLLDPGREVFTRVYTVGIPSEVSGSTFPVAGSRSGAVIKTDAAYVSENFGTEPLPSYMDTSPYRALGPMAIVPVRSEEEVIGTLAVARPQTPEGRAFTDAEVRMLEAIAEVGGTAIRRARLYQHLQRQVETQAALYESAQKLAESLDLHRLADDVVRRCVDSFGVSLAWIARAGPHDSGRLLAQYPLEHEFPRRVLAYWNESPQTRGTLSQTLRANTPVLTGDIAEDPRRHPWWAAALELGLRSGGAFPLISRTKAFGMLGLYSDQPEFFTTQRIEFFQAYAHQVAAALENARLYDEADRRLRRLQALRDIDVTISGNLDLRVILDVLLDRVTAQLQVDAADVLLFNPHTQTLDYAAGRGFHTGALQHTHLRLGESHAGRAALDRRLVSIPDLTAESGGFTQAPLLAEEGFTAYYAVPLIAKGQVKGVLEIFHRASLTPDGEWFDFLDALAGQAAIAIDGAMLFVALQRSNADLILAYDTTIEGWARALELRDNVTEGHTRRVTDLTLRLARAMGVPEGDLVHIRRGALLHDIGKMGIPDSILLKPGPLTSEEWEIMRRHPIYAYDLLSHIAYLRPALDIPYCHHEKWDGTGYPRNLQGEHIPLAARIFAVVDVWDALCSDRPYRPAWSIEKVQKYIRENAGSHFDPKVVEAFL